jgi:hypothetical protein
MKTSFKTSVGVLVGIAALLIVTAAQAQAPEPIMGTWTLDVAKSTYKPGPGPKQSTLTVDPAGKGIKVAVDSVNADGSPLKWGFTSARDGKEEAPVTGNPLFDVVTSTRESATAGTNVYKKGGKVVMTSKIAVSADGKSMTVTSTGTDMKGQAVHNVSTYIKK